MSACIQIYLVEWKGNLNYATGVKSLCYTFVFAIILRRKEYDEVNQYLYVQFKGGSVYVYDGVVKYVYDGFINAESIGRYFGQYIRNKYKYTQLS